MARKIIGPPFIYNPETNNWEQVGATDIHRVQRSVEQPVDPNVEIWIKVITKDDGSSFDIIMLKDKSDNWYAPNDKNQDGIPDRAAIAANSEKLGDYSPSHYATAESVTRIINGTTVVDKALKDGNGNNIINTYATKQELTEIDTLVNETVNTNLNAIIDGTKKVAKATVADSATKATQDGNGNVITSTYAKQADLTTTNTNITNITNGTTTVPKATAATKATQDGSGNVITSTYVNLTGAQTISGAKTFSGATKITNTTAASSTSTGALIVSGGIGCAGSIYGSKVYGAVYNDYAERRLSKNNIPCGMLAVEDSENSDYIKPCNKDCAIAPMIVSDTHGFCMGEQSNEEEGIYSLPIGVSGRVLAYVSPRSSSLKVGDVVCSSADGKIRKMKWWEKVLKPECIIGTVSSIPDYEIWGTASVQVNERVWIKIK